MSHFGTRHEKVNRMGTAGKRRLAVFALIAASILSIHTPPSAAQMNMSGHGMETRDEIAPSDLPAAQRMTGVGNVHLQITASAEAQAWFDQGLNLLHDFWYYESARAFEQAIRTDAQCAMCYWGLYKAESVYNRSTRTAQGYAAQALASAVSLKGHVSKQERLYIEASAAFERAAKNSKHSPDRSREVHLLREVVKKYPRDTEARIFLSEALEDGFDDNGEPNAGQKETIAILQGVLKDEPENSAANHYYIHAQEPGAHPELALHSAEILANLAPASGHVVHMPGHIFFRLGDYARAQQAFAASMQVDDSYMRANHVQPDDDWNYVHNLMYSIANLMEEGKLNDATALSSKLAGARGDLEFTLYTTWTRDSMSRIDPRLPVALRTADWARVLAMSKAGVVPETQPNLRFLMQQLTDFAAGMQAVEARDLSKAEESSARLDAALGRMSNLPKESSGMKSKATDKASLTPLKLEVMPDAKLAPLLKSLSIMSLELRASLLAAKNQIAEAKKLFAQAAQQEKALGYREPPAYIRPVGETEATALIAAGDWIGARAAYQQALLERPRSGFSLYGIAVCSEKASDSAAAAREYADFLSAWKDADPSLTQMAHARDFVAQHPVVAGGLGHD
jgi:tetratricopeptide (TPR) repeat protein